MELIYFKKCFFVSGLDIHSSNIIMQEVGGKNKIILELRAPSKEERLQGYKSFNAMCTVFGELQPTKNSAPVFKAILKGKRPLESKKTKSADDMVIREGPELPLNYYPNPFINFIERINREFSQVTTQFIHALRWRCAQEGPRSPLASIGLFWSIDKKKWHPAPANYTIESNTPNSSILNIEQLYENALREVISQNEPVYHELLREAKDIRFKSTRSALILAVSAAEVAVKHVVSHCAPDTEWLVNNLPSPPIVRIIKNYFPKIVHDYEKNEPACTLVDSIENAVGIRNRMVHRGEGSPNVNTVNKIINAISGFIWLCDYYCGNEWALHNVKKNQIANH